MAEDRSGNEARLVRRCADGEEAAWELLVTEYGPVLAGIARRMLSRRQSTAADADVDEVVAEVFLSLLRRDRLLLRRYDPQWRLATYLGVLCRTAVSRLLRRRGVGTVASPGTDALPDLRDEPEGLAALTLDERAVALARLREGLGQLVPRDRLLLTGRYLEDLDYRTLAEAAGVKIDSVGSLLGRARRRLLEAVPDLASLLGEEPEDPDV